MYSKGKGTIKCIIKNWHIIRLFQLPSLARSAKQVSEKGTGATTFNRQFIGDLSS